MRESPKHRSLWTPVILLVGFIIIAIFGPAVVDATKGCGREAARPKAVSKRVRPSTPTPTKVQPPSMFAGMPEKLAVADQFLARVISAAENAAQGNEADEALVQRFRRHAIAARLVDAEQFGAFMSSSATPQRTLSDVIFVYISPDERRKLRRPIFGSFMYETDRQRIVFAPEDAVSDWFLGALILHELTHWDDVQVTKREPAQPTPQEYADGEVRAYSREIMTIDRMTNGAFGSHLARIIRDPRSHCKRGEEVLPTRKGWEAMQQAWPAFAPSASDEETAARDAVLFIAMTFLSHPESRRPAAYMAVHERHGKGMEFCD